jgi:alkaline phosphatase D
MTTMSIITTRRDFLTWSAAALAPVWGASALTHQATGVKIGEITPTSVRFWTRRTKASTRFAAGIRSAPGLKATVLPLGYDPAKLEGACPGAPGQLRVVVRNPVGKIVTATPWAEAKAATDFSEQFTVSGLEPATAYKYTVETRDGKRTDGMFSGVFRTAPRQDALVDVNVGMLSCQKYSQRDNDRGFLLYDSIAKWAPHFMLSVGDNVYYDSDDPKVNHVSIARHHWHRMYSLPTIAECLRRVPGYWLKDDHDCYSDDCWPGYVNPSMNPFTFEEGLKLFPEQAPLGAVPYRRFRWGRGLEIFLIEGRDYRASNRDADGPSKSLWGSTQKQWLLDGLNKSEARWKVIVSPGPLIGPDRQNKHDNHSNDAFQTEGREFRQWLAANSRVNDTVWVNGDRHWQYHSVDPETKVNEFCCGAASDSHAAGTPGEDPRLHRFHRVKGGFLAIQVRVNGTKSELVLEHRDVAGNRVYGQSFA